MRQTAQNSLGPNQGYDIVNVAIIEDDLGVANTIGRMLSGASESIIFQTRVMSTASAALTAAFDTTIDIFIVDLRIPSKPGALADIQNGLNLIGKIAEIGNSTIVVFSSEQREAFFEDAFYAGADEFIEKSESVQYLAKKIVAIWRLLKKTRKQADLISAGFGETFNLGNWQFVFGEKRLTSNNNASIRLSTMEHAFIGALLRSENRTLNREQIYAFVFGRPALPSDRSLANLVASLRRKLPSEISIHSSNDGNYELRVNSD